MLRQDGLGQVMLKKCADQLAWFAMLLAVVPVAFGQSAPVRERISARQVADAMSVAGIVVNAAQVEVLSGSVRAKENASLRVVSVRDKADGGIMVKLRCQNNQQCLPFYALVHGVDGATTGAVRGREAKQLASNPHEALPQTIIRGGDRATLILESADSRMRIPVVCLQNGAVGEKIHVASPDHRQFFDAEVVAVGMLKGKL